MTTRVNKGGTVFRPVAKAKSRGPSVPASSVSRQASIISDASPSNDSQAFGESTFQAALSSRAMPPPSMMPSELAATTSQASSTGHFSVLAMQTPANPHLSPAPPSISVSSRVPLIPPRPINALPSLAITQQPIPRTTSVPPLVASANPRKHVTVVPSPTPPSISISSTNAPSNRTLPLTPSLAPSSDRTLLEEFPTDPMRVGTGTQHTEGNESSEISPTQVVDHAVNTSDSDDRTAGRDKGGRTKRRTSEANSATEAELSRNAYRRSTTPPEDAEADSHTKSRRKRKSPSDDDASKVSRRRRARSPSLPRFDPEQGPGEELDPTVVTMAALCADTGQGRISSKAVEIQSNFASWKTQSKQQRARLKELAELRKYGKITDDGEAAILANETNTSTAPQPLTSTPEAGDNLGDEFDYSQDLPSNRFNPQVRIGPNGETIIDEESLVVDREPEVDTSGYTHVVESDTSKFVNSGTYRKKCRGSRWSKEETELFYHALSQYGENYELLAFVLPGRDRTACKNKFKAEDRKNPARITYCLDNRIPVDISVLSRMTGKDFSGPCPEIRMPPPKVPPPVPTATISEAEGPPQKSLLKVKKRSRSRSMALTDDVQILGSADTYNPTDD